MATDYLRFVVQSSPLARSGQPNWLEELVPPIPKEEQKVAHHKKDSPRPQSKAQETHTAAVGLDVPDPVVMKWLSQSEPTPSRGHDASTNTTQRHNDLPRRTPNATANTTAVSSSTAPQQNSTKSVHNTSRSLAERSVQAQASKHATENEHAFWKSRLRWLRSMVEQAERECQRKDAQASQSEASKVLQESVAAQLEAEKQRDHHLLSEKIAANRVRREAHHTAMKETRQSLLKVKQEQSRRQKERSSEAAIEVDEQRRKDLHTRTATKEAVQESKVLGVLQRALNQSMRAEEARRLYEHRILRIEEDDAKQQQRTVEMIHEGSRLVQKIRSLQHAEEESFGAEDQRERSSSSIKSAPQHVSP